MRVDVNDGGQAFPLYVPTQHTGDNSEVINGMTLRDKFADSAMAALIQTPVDRWPNCDSASLTACAYEMADAMLAAREAA